MMMGAAVVVVEDGGNVSSECTFRYVSLKVISVIGMLVVMMGR